MTPQKELLINGEPAPCLVKEVSESPLQTSATDYVLFFQYGKSDIARQKVKKGDIIRIDQKLVQARFGTPGADILQVLHGYPSIVKDGEFHEGEYNDFENGREKEVSPHTMAGVSKDGKTLYLFAVDGRSSRSVGTTCLEIAGYMVADGVSDIVNFDSGGSTTMVVNDKTVNVPSDGSERSVMDSFHAVSLAPEDNTVSSISFNHTNLRTVAGAKTMLPVLAYNLYGDLISQNLENVSLSNTTPEAGLIQNNSYIALKAGASDCIKANVNGVSTEFKVSVLKPDTFYIETRNAIVGKDPVVLPVRALLGKKIFELDGQAIEWTIEDPAVCKVENGVLTGLSNGKTKLIATLEGMQDEIEVRVEILDGIHTIEDFTDHSSFTLQGTSNIKNLQFALDGLPQEWEHGANLSFDFTKGRASNLSIVKNIEFQGQPDSLLLTLNPGEVAIKSLMIYLSNEKEARGWSYQLSVPENSRISTLRIPLLNQDGEKLTSDEYPLTLNKLYFLLDDRSMANSPFNMQFRDMKAKYGESDQEVSVPSASVADGLIMFPNPASEDITIRYNLHQTAVVEYYITTIDGYTLMSLSKGRIPLGVIQDRLRVSGLPKGMYFFVVKAGKESKTIKFLKK